MSLLIAHGMQFMALAMGLAVVFWGVALVRQWPRLGWATTSLFIVLASDFPVSPAIANAAGLAVYPEDVFAVVLLLGNLGRMGRVARQLGALGAPLLFFVSLTLLSLLRGAVAFGVSAAVNEFRATGYFVVLGMWVLGQRSDDGFDVLLKQFLQWTGWALVGVAALHVSMRGLGTADQQTLQNGIYVTSRPLISGQAILLAAAGVYCLALRTRMAAGVTFIVVAVLCQHRSVWVALVLSVVATFLVGRPEVRARLASVLGGLTVVAILLVGYGVGSSIVSDLSHSLTSSGTFNGRTEGWGELVAEQNTQGWGSILLGQPMGTGFVRFDSAHNVFISYAPHNWYVMIYLRVGLVGLISIFVGLSLAMVANVRNRSLLGVAFLILIAVYAIPYDLPWYLAPLMAAGLAPSGEVRLRVNHGRSFEGEARSLPLSNDPPLPTISLVQARFP